MKIPYTVNALLPGTSEQDIRLKKMTTKIMREINKSPGRTMKILIYPWQITEFSRLKECQKKTILNLYNIISH